MWSNYANLSTQNKNVPFWLKLIYCLWLTKKRKKYVMQDKEFLFVFITFVIFTPPAAMQDLTQLHRFLPLNP